MFTPFVLLYRLRVIRFIQLLRSYTQGHLPVTGYRTPGHVAALRNRLTLSGGHCLRVTKNSQGLSATVSARCACSSFRERRRTLSGSYVSAHITYYIIMHINTFFYIYYYVSFPFAPQPALQNLLLYYIIIITCWRWAWKYNNAPVNGGLTVFTALHPVTI